MCIIAIKPRGIEMPDETIRHNMWDGNSDGAGYMVADGNRVTIEKGFMKLKDIEKALEAEGNLTDKTVVLHYRITTHGGTKAENCHPFPISGNVSILKKPRTVTDVGMAHNGIIDIRARSGISDTMEYDLSQLSHMKKIDSDFWRKQEWLDLIEDAIDSKMVFLGKDGNFTVIGDFIEDNGCLYSNTSYKGYTYKGKYSKLGGSYSAWGWDDEEWSKYGVGYTYRMLMDLYSYEDFSGDTVFVSDGVGEENNETFESLADTGTLYAIDRYGSLYEYMPSEDAYYETFGSAVDEKGRLIEFDDSLSELTEVMLY